MHSSWHNKGEQSPLYRLYSDYLITLTLDERVSFVQGAPLRYLIGCECVAEYRYVLMWVGRGSVIKIYQEATIKPTNYKTASL